MLNREVIASELARLSSETNDRCVIRGQLTKEIEAFSRVVATLQMLGDAVKDLEYTLEIKEEG